METYSSHQSEDALSNIEEPYSGSDLLLLIWTQPRRVITYLVEYEPTKYVTILLMLHGVWETLQRMLDKQAGETFGLIGIIGFALLLGPFGGLISAYMFSPLLSLSGTWLKGKATSVQIRTVMAWSSVPVILLLVVLPIEMILFGVEPFSKEQPTMEDHPVLVAIFDLVIVLLSLWTVVLFLVGLSQVQGFSVGKAILNCLLAGLIIIIPIALIIFLFMGIDRLINMA